MVSLSVLGQNTAASIVAHNDDVLDVQRLDTVR